MANGGVCGPIVIDQVHVRRVTDPSEPYASWPQGKLHAVGSKLYIVYNSGGNHGGTDLAVYERSTDDSGFRISDRRLICAEPGWRYGATAWSAGCSEAGIRSIIVRLRGRSYRPYDPVRQPDGTEHRLLTRDDAQNAWRARRIEFPFSDLFGGDGPVMYHGYRPTRNGFESYWHMPKCAGVGARTVLDGQVCHSVFPIDSRTDQLCEPTAVDLPDGSVGGFLRSETSCGPVFWSTDSSRQATMLRKPIAGIDAVKSPVPIARCGTVCIAASCDRRGDAVLRLHACDLSDTAMTAKSWASLDLLGLQSIIDGASGTGVPDISVIRDRLFIAFGYQPRASRVSAVNLLSCRIMLRAS